MTSNYGDHYLGICGVHAPRVVVAIDLKGVIVECNLLAEKFLGNREELIGQSVNKFISFPEINEDEHLIDYYERKSDIVSKQFRSYAKFKNSESKIVDISLKKITELNEDYFIAYLESRVGIQVLSETALHQVADLVTGTDPQNYFDQLVRDVSLTLNVDYALIGVFIDDDVPHIDTLAAFVNGKHVDNFSYDLDHTPCKKVLQRGSFHCYESDVKNTFPKDQMLTDLNMQGYAGIALHNSDQSLSGLLVIGHKHEIDNRSVVESVLKIFSVRAAHEIERISITKQKTAAERTLISTEERYKAIFNSAVNGFVLWTPEKEIIDINPAIWEAHGCTKEQYLNIGFFKFIHDESKPLFDLINNCIAHGKQFRVEIKQVRIDGSEFINEVRGVPVEFNNQPLYLTVSVNLTEQKKSEEEKVKLETQLRQAQKMESIGHLSGGIAHDFNNMLTGILGNVDLAISRVDAHGDEKTEKYLNRAKRSSVRARDLIQQLLTFSRGQKGEKTQLAFTPLIKECVKLLESTLPSSITLNTNFNINVPSVMCDPVQIEQVLMNLCINARDAMQGNGDLTIEVTSEKIKDDVCASCKQTLNDHYAVILVKDSGCGMPRVVIDRIFEPFFTTKEVGKGTGMGLSTVHGIVHESKGHILVNSVIDEGTTFKILYPIADHAIQDSAVDLTDGSSLSSGKTLLSGRILVIDDEEDVCDYLNDLFESLGLNVETRTNPIDARNEFLNGNGQFDLIITDQTMPNLKGIELAKEIRLHQPTIPIILHTGYADKALEAQASELGINELVKKPCDAKTLTDHVKRILMS